MRLANNAVQIKKGAAGVLSHSYLGFQSMILTGCLLFVCMQEAESGPNHRVVLKPPPIAAIAT